MPNFSDFELDEKLLKTLADLGYETPTPVQEQAIPKVLSGSDLIASAQTGTGKTAAFMLPSLQKLITSPRPRACTPRILVLAPTRELAMQITAVTEKYTRQLPQIRTVCVYGGEPYPVQIKALSRPYDILVATPGRLIDHMQQRRIDLSSLEFLILDEADRMLDMGFIDAVETIAATAPKNRQTLLFSATLDPKILRLSRKLQNNPEEVRIETTVEANANIEQRLYYVDGMSHKMRLLDHILENTQMEQAIVFISTRNGADTLADHLQEKGHITEALHGNMSQRQRTRTIAKLRRGNINVLVATDVAARGIDILTVSHVINIDLPFQAEDYVHRVGRTGRAGGKGVAITFATYREQQAISKINQLLASPMVPHTIEGFEPAAKSNDNSSPRPRGGRPAPRGAGKWGRDSSRPPRREFNSEPGRERNFNNDAPKSRDFGDAPRKPRDFGDAPRRPREFNKEQGGGSYFDKGPKRNKDAGFSGKPRGFGNDKRKDFGFSGRPRSFNNDAPRSKDFGFSDKPRDINPEAPSRKSFQFSGKPRGFNADAPKRKEFGGFSGKPRGFNDSSRERSPSAGYSKEKRFPSEFGGKERGFEKKKKESFSSVP